MQKFLIKQGLCAAICLTMAFSACAIGATAAISGASITIAAEAGTAESLEYAEQQKLNTVSVAKQGFFRPDFAELNRLKAEVTQAIIPEP